MSIKDSGSKREFSTGSHRDFAEGKGRCDLLPEVSVLEVIDLPSSCPEHSIQGHLTEAVKNIMQYKINTVDSKNLNVAASEALIAVGLAEGSDMEGVNLDDIKSCRAIGLMKTAIHYEEGAKKYGENNWKLGQPLHVLIDSGLRHCFKGIAGNNDEPHVRAAAWNFLCAIWTLKNLPDMQDLPLTGNMGPVEANVRTAKY